MKTCHLVLKHEFYDLIENGKKRIEYRNNTSYWRKRILRSDRVTFHKGYTNITITFGIRFVTLNHQITIYLGARVDGMES